MADLSDIGKGFEAADNSQEKYTKSIGEADKTLNKLNERVSGLSTVLDKFGAIVKETTRLKEKEVSEIKKAATPSSAALGKEFNKSFMGDFVESSLGKGKSLPGSKVGGMEESFLKFGKSVETETLSWMKSLGASGETIKTATPFIKGLGAGASAASAAFNGLVIATKIVDAAQKFSFDAQRDVMNKMSAAGLSYSKDVQRAGESGMRWAEASGVSQAEFSTALSIGAQRLPAFQAELAKGGLELSKELKGIAAGTGLTFTAVAGFVQEHGKTFGLTVGESKKALQEMDAAATHYETSLGAMMQMTDSVEASYRPYIKHHGDVVKALEPYSRELDMGVMSMEAFNERVYGFASVGMGAANALRELSSAPEALEGLAPETAKLVAEFRKDTEGLSAAAVEAKMKLGEGASEKFEAMGKAVQNYVRNTMEATGELKGLTKEQANYAIGSRSAEVFKGLGLATDATKQFTLAQHDSKASVKALTEVDKSGSADKMRLYRDESEAMVTVTTQLGALGKAATSAAIQFVGLDRGLKGGPARSTSIPVGRDWDSALKNQSKSLAQTGEMVDVAKKLSKESGSDYKETFRLVLQAYHEGFRGEMAALHAQVLAQSGQVKQIMVQEQ